MKKHTKIWLILGACLVLSGLLLMVVALGLNGWGFDNLSTVEYETKTYHITEDFSNLFIDGNTEDILFVPSEDDSCKVVCQGRKDSDYSVRVEEDTLYIAEEDSRQWHTLIEADFGETEITVYLPREEYGTVTVDTDTGDVEIPGDFTFESINISGSTGSVKCHASSIVECNIELSTGHITAENMEANRLFCEVSTGNINLSQVSCETNITLSLSTGKANLTDVQCSTLLAVGDTGKLMLKDVIAADTLELETSTGDITLDNCDGEMLVILTDTGDITGSLRSEKVFFTSTDTGSVNVPRTAKGGTCDLMTSTGDIHITINEPS